MDAGDARRWKILEYYKVKQEHAVLAHRRSALQTSLIEAMGERREFDRRLRAAVIKQQLAAIGPDLQRAWPADFLVTGPAEPPVVSCAGQMIVLGPGQYRETRLGGQLLIASAVYSGQQRARTATDNVWIGRLPVPSDAAEAKISIAADGVIQTGTLRWQKPAPAPAPVVPIRRKRKSQ
jgi:hypothetical protein